jgi:hypothetical protein
MGYGTWNAGSLYRAGSLTAVARETVRLMLVGVQEVTWDRGGTEPAGDDYTCLWKWESELRTGDRIFLT